MQNLTYSSWCSMMLRCSMPDAIKYRYYGERGIRVCERWKIFKNFLKDMGERPSGKWSIERMNNQKGYTPSNCKWILKSQQNKNRTFFISNKLKSNNTSGIRGVSKYRDGWYAYLNVNGHRIGQFFKNFKQAGMFRKELEKTYRK